MIGEPLPAVRVRPAIVAIVDTTATFPDLTFTSTPWMQLFTLSIEGRASVVVPGIVLRETARHWEKTVRANRGDARRSIQKLHQLGASKRPDVLGLFLDNIDSAQHLARMTNRLTSFGVSVPALPDVDLESLVVRDLERQKPFNESGKGFRDALVWEHVKAIAESAADDQTIYFVTNNTKDFCDDGALAANLASELPRADRVRHAAHLSALLATPELQPLVAELAVSGEELAIKMLALPADRDRERTALQLLGERLRQALVAGAEALTSEMVETENETAAGLDFLGVGLSPAIEGVQISTVEADEDTATWDLFRAAEPEPVAALVVVRGEIDARITFDGLIHKPDAYTLGNDIEVVNWDWSEHMAEIEVHAQARLVFDLTIRSDGAVERSRFVFADQQLNGRGD